VTTFVYRAGSIGTLRLWRAECHYGWTSRRYPFYFMAAAAARTHLRLSPQCDDRRMA